MRRILIVEDDRLLGQTLAFNLISDGYAVTLAGNRAEALGQWRPDTFELLILDVNLPDGNGFDLCATLRERGETCYILFLTANDRESDMMRGYEMGGSDYLTKPFSVAVLGRKIAAIFDAMENRQPHHEKYDDGYLTIDFSAQTSTLGGQAIEFTPKEYKTLRLFTANANLILTKNQLLEKLWDDEGNFVDEHTLTTIISRIRKKVEREGHTYIRTSYGVGYQWIGGGKP